jgi:hypothetical protein
VTYTYELSNDIGRVRLLVPDRNQENAVFSDEEITAFVSLEGGVYRAAALALETVASDTAATLRVTRTLGLEVDGAKASDALLKRAAGLRKQADDIEARDVPLFDWAEMALNGPSAREILRNDVLRSGI